MQDDSNEFRENSAFLDDFYAECDEHLLELRRALAQMEALRSQELTAPLQGSLTRQLHSLKGIVGMAQLSDCERLTHSAEDFVKCLAQNRCRLDADAVDALAAVVQALEHSVAAHRQKKSLPDLTPIQNRITEMLELASLTAQARLEAQPAEPVEHAAPLQEIVPKTAGKPSAGRRVLEAAFNPTPELSQAGININTVRARLQELGEIIRSEPRIEPNGRVVFEFSIAVTEPPADLERWNSHGLTLRESEAEAAGKFSSHKTTRETVATSGPAYVTPSHIVRIDLSRLDELMRAMGEMVVHRARLEDLAGRVEKVLPPRDARELEEINDALSRELRRLRDGLMRVRLVPIAEIFERMSLVVRDVGRETGRPIRLAMHGQETQIDKYIVERLKEPFLHLVRNAGIHSMQSPAERAAQGKPEALTITLRAEAVGESVILEISDDGAGIHPGKILQRAKEAGLALPEDPTEADLLELLCQPGFSTQEYASRAAGRGVGMAVVKTAVADLGGELRLRSEPGRGTTFMLRLPLTLAIAEALIIGVDTHRFAVLQSGVQEIITLGTGEVVRIEGAEFARYREGILPIIHLSRLFKLPETGAPERPVLVVGHGSERVGLMTDHVYGQREIIVRALSDPMFKIPAVSGATELGDGRPVLILDVVNLITRALNRKHLPHRGTIPEMTHA